MMGAYSTFPFFSLFTDSAVFWLSTGVCSAGASWLVHSTPERAVQVECSPGQVILLCTWERHFTPTVHLSTRVYRWVNGDFNARGGGGGGNHAMD